MLEITGSGASTGWITMSAYLPALLFSLPAGALADHLYRKRILLISDLARALLVLSIPLLFSMDLLTPLIAWSITFASALFHTVFNPARDSLIPDLAPDSMLANANTIIQTGWQLSLLGGPALAALLIPLTGTVSLFYGDSLSYLLSFLLILLIQVPSKTIGLTETGAAGESHGKSQKSQNHKVNLQGFQKSMIHTLQQMGEGIQFVRSRPGFTPLLLITALDNIFIMGPAIMGIPYYVKHTLLEGAVQYANLTLALSLGLISGSALIPYLQRRFTHHTLLGWGLLLDGITFLPLYWIQTPLLASVAVAIHGVVIPLILIPRITLLQRLTPARMRGRVFSLLQMGVAGSTSLSIAIAGEFLEWRGAPELFAAAAAGGTLCGLIYFIAIPSSHFSESGRKQVQAASRDIQ